MSLEDATEGMRYRVTISDCCVEGSFDAVLLLKTYLPDDGTDPQLDTVHFDNGVTLSGWAIELEEVQAAG
jgi:hypothetical protein